MQIVTITCDACGKEAVRRATTGETLSGQSPDGVVCDRVVVGTVVYDVCPRCLGCLREFLKGTSDALSR